jgi:hypothetical protein
MRKVDGYPLWIGNAGDLRRPTELHVQGIEAVVDLAASEPAATLPREVVYCRFPIVDGSGNSPWMLRMAIEVVTSLLTAEITTLVACGVGMSRSLAIAAAAISRIAKCLPIDVLPKVVAGGACDVSASLWSQILVLGE